MAVRRVRHHLRVKMDEALQEVAHRHESEACTRSGLGRLANAISDFLPKDGAPTSTSPIMLLTALFRDALA